MLTHIQVRGAREHNLKNVDLDLPRDSLVVITGLSGSGKSSLAFDTIYAEGQRRYVESLSAYARQFLEMMQKPDVDHIEGLSPAISIEQKTTSKNPRSTVATVTEIYDYMRLLWARIGVPYSPATGLPITAQTVSQMVDRVLALPEGTRLLLLAPIVRGRKGEYRKELAQLQKDGFGRVKIDGQVYEIGDAPALDKKYKHDIDVVVDRVVVRPDMAGRLAESFEQALKLADGLAVAEVVDVPPLPLAVGARDGEAGPGAGNGREADSPTPDPSRKREGSEDLLAPGHRIVFSEKFACPVSGFTIAEIEPRLFSFNAPQGACPACDGLGEKMFFDPQLIVPNENLTLAAGAIAPWARSNPPSPYYQQVLASLGRAYGFDLKTKWSALTPAQQHAILHGSGGKPVALRFEDGRKSYEVNKPFEGVVGNLQRRLGQTESAMALDDLARYQSAAPCEVCHGDRLRPEALAVKVDGETIADAVRRPVGKALPWAQALSAKLNPKDRTIAERIMKEIVERLGFLDNVGLDYLNLDRKSGTLCGGESQRIRLASQIGSGLSGVLYVLDEPSIGLHQRDNDRLLVTLKRLRDLGNTVLVVEHDEDAIRAADYVVDMGPGAGVHGGAVVARGSLQDILDTPGSITGDYLSGRRAVAVPAKRRKGNGKKLTVKNARSHNLRGVTASIPLGTFTCITGVSRLGQVDLHHRHALRRRRARAERRPRHRRRARLGRRPAAPRQGHRHRPVADRPHPALEPRDLHRRLHLHPRLVRRPARKPRPRLQARALQLQRQGRAVRGVHRRRADQDRDALPARRLRHLRRLPRRALQPRDAGGEVQGQVDRRRAEHDGRGRRRVLQGRPPDPRPAGDAARGRPRLRRHRPVGDDLERRRGAARQARQGTRPPRHRPDALHPRRADHRPPLRGRPQAPRSPPRPRRPGQHRRRHRTQSGGHQDRRLGHRPGARTAATRAGEIVATGTPEAVAKVERSLTGGYLRGLLG